ncbi:hypothetical protein BDP27DRAFT_1318044 [Rhodocollybia butyracea]|uniref:Uncharacterized protein n=1 Tax=Rhodocollybia butyracea TaxID=206335 RepID=A0A9P5UC42_9AGAR|nr:hypothetical protein BDP27DRAFT_1318044 [Rhodocollybia butyracea]
MAPFCRLFAPSTTLVLDACSVEVFIADVHASVTLSQRFTNPNGLTLNATYAFGLLSGVAVCGFEMIRNDGTRIEGIAQSKEDAIREFRQLGQEQTHDVFSISVGNIGAYETVTINLRFVQALTDDEYNDQVKFIFPCVYAQRYGSAPSSIASSAPSIAQPFRMNVTIQQASPIKSVSCPSGHPINFSVPSRDGTLAKVSLKHHGFLTQDVILVMTAENLDSPRCFIESHPSSDHATTALALTFVPRFEIPDVDPGMEYIFMIDRSGSMAGSRIRLVKNALVVLLRSLPTKGTIFNLVSFGTHTTTLWPRSWDYSQFSVDLATQYVDDMEADYGGTEIPSALRTVFSSLRKSLNHPAAVFLLTDGSSWEVSDCVSAVTAAVHQSKDAEKPFLRVFTVGIGAGASTDMCDSIARAGGGTSVYVQDGEEIIGKCARLVRAARTPPIHIEVEWIGIEENKSHFTKEVLEMYGKTEDFDAIDDNGDAKSNAETIVENPVSLPINLFQSSAVDLMRGTGPPDEHIHPPPPTIQQAPHTMPRLYPGTRTQIYAILKSGSADFLNLKGGGGSNAIPKFIKIRGWMGMTGLPVELEVPVTKLMNPLSALSSTSSSGISKLFSSSRIQSKAQAEAPLLPFLHVLAAKALIADLQDGKHRFSNSVSESGAFNRNLFCKKEIIRLGTAYGLTSEHTSFIAADHSRRMFSVSQQSHGAKIAPLKVSHMISSNASSMSRRGSEFTSPAYDYLRNPLRSGMPVSFSGYHDPTIEDCDPAQHDPEMYSANCVHSTVEPPNPASKNLNAPFQSRSLISSRLRPQSLSISSLPTRASTSPFRRILLISKDTPVTSLPISPSTGRVVSQPISTTVETPLATSSAKTSTPPMTPGERLAAVARLQRYDGGFVWSRILFRTLGLNLADPDVFKSQLNAEGIAEDTAATVLAWMWLEINGGEDGSDMARKAGQWLGSNRETLKKQLSAITPLSW